MPLMRRIELRAEPLHWQSRHNLKPPLKGEDSPQRGEMSAQPTERGVEVGRRKPSRRGLLEWRVE